MLPGLVFSNIYSNSMMALLNDRVVIIKGRSDCAEPDSIELQSTVLRSRVAVVACGEDSPKPPGTGA
jgi:hypothetical protein